MKQQKIKIKFKKLGREKAFGQAISSESLIELDPRQKQKTMLNTLIHELLHIIEPDWTENKVSKTASILARYIWEAKFRKLSE
jgi:hypothetical protein